MTKDRSYVAAITILLTIIVIILSFAFKDSQVDAKIKEKVDPIVSTLNALDDELTPKVNANTLILGRIESKIGGIADVLTEVQLKVARIEAKVGD